MVKCIDLSFLLHWKIESYHSEIEDDRSEVGLFKGVE